MANSISFATKHHINILEQYDVERREEINKTIIFTKLLNRLMTDPDKNRKLWKLFLFKLRKEPSFKSKCISNLSGGSNDSIYRVFTEGEYYISGYNVAHYSGKYILYLPESNSLIKNNHYSEILDIQHHNNSSNLIYLTSPQGKIILSDTATDKINIEKYLALLDNAARIFDGIEQEIEDISIDGFADDSKAVEKNNGDFVNKIEGF